VIDTTRGAKTNRIDSRFLFGIRAAASFSGASIASASTGQDVHVNPLAITNMALGELPIPLGTGVSFVGSFSTRRVDLS
jgi:hypothetical protein